MVLRGRLEDTSLRLTESRWVQAERRPPSVWTKALLVAALLEGKESQGKRAQQDLTTPFSFLPVARSHLSPHKNSSFVEAKEGSNSADPQSCDQ